MGEHVISMQSGIFLATIGKSGFAISPPARRISEEARVAQLHQFDFRGCLNDDVGGSYPRSMQKG